MKNIELANKNFGRLIAIKSIGKDIHGYYEWECICSCGKKVIVSSTRLIRGVKRSCGCYQRETSSIRAIKRFTRHGHNTQRGKSRAYTSWDGMTQRCKNPNNQAYKNYGGRGITICDRWQGKNGFINFLEDMGERPEGLSIDRIDNNKGYYKENCRWATHKEQQNNTRLAKANRN